VLLEKVGLEVMMLIGARFEERLEPVSQTELEQRKFVPPILTRQIITKLLKADLVVVAGDNADQLVPARSTDQITAADIINALRHDHSHLSDMLQFSSCVDGLSEEYQKNIDTQFSHQSLRDLINKTEQ
jgi:membrane protein